MAKHLFDDSERIYGPIRYSESHFEYLNRSAHTWAGTVRDTFESWYAQFPEVKRPDLRSRFHSDDGQLLGASLEIVTHAILESVATDVHVEPHLAGGRPDFQADYQGTTFAAESTVAHESDSTVSGTRRENTVKDLINSIDSNAFYLEFHLVEGSQTQLPTRKLRRELECWLASFDSRKERQRIARGGALGTFSWCEQGWSIEFNAIPVDTRFDPRSIGIEFKGPVDASDNYKKLKRALTKKADAYRSIELPYLVVAGSATDMLGDEEELFEALFGPRYCKIDPGRRAVVSEDRRWDGLWGSPSRPRNRHVSAVLHRPWRNPWEFCTQPLVATSSSDILFETEEDAFAAGDEERYERCEWRFVHNPWAVAPLQRGLFPFAEELYAKSESLVRAKPKLTLNKVLGLSDPWPGDVLQSEKNAWYSSQA